MSLKTEKALPSLLFLPLLFPAPRLSLSRSLSWHGALPYRARRRTTPSPPTPSSGAHSLCANAALRPSSPSRVAFRSASVSRHADESRCKSLRSTRFCGEQFFFFFPSSFFSKYPKVFSFAVYILRTFKRHFAAINRHTKRATGTTRCMQLIW